MSRHVKVTREIVIANESILKNSEWKKDVCEYFFSY